MFTASIVGALFGVFVIARVWIKRTRRQRVRAMKPGYAWHSAIIAFRYFEVPFGVFLGAAAIFAAFYGDAVVRWYAGLFG